MPMLAAVFDGKNVSLREDMEVPKINKDNEVLIKVKAVGICGTDLSILKGTYQIPVPRILGHEFSGVVSEIGKKVTNFQIGDRVTSEINLTCGACYFCKAGQKTQCTSRRAMGIDEDGAFAKYIKVPESNLYNIHDLPFEEATFIEPLAAAIQTFEMAPLKESDKTVVILGAGKLGLLILQVVKNKGRKAIVIGRSHLELAKKLGADLTLSVVKDKEPVRRVMEETKIGADVVVEATGTPESLDLALSLVRNRGTVNLKSTHGIRWMMDPTQLVVHEIKLQGSRCGPFPPAIQMIEQGSVHVMDLISATYPLTKISEAVDAAMKPESVKIIITP
ncbi:MAG TPA: alcohol dehydrogenase catalytic domain-containing protein [Candidatus Deferrimicrobium sp.]|nr:alcohol dehydrogenase catalytic domain-containing protein [Candidatus Deferrimicrobium sp.]